MEQFEYENLVRQKKDIIIVPTIFFVIASEGSYSTTDPLFEASVSSRPRSILQRFPPQLKLVATAVPGSACILQNVRVFSLYDYVRYKRHGCQRGSRETCASENCSTRHPCHKKGPQLQATVNYDVGIDVIVPALP